MIHVNNLRKLPVHRHIFITCSWNHWRHESCKSNWCIWDHAVIYILHPALFTITHPVTCYVTYWQGSRLGTSSIRERRPCGLLTSGLVSVKFRSIFVRAIERVLSCTMHELDRGDCRAPGSSCIDCQTGPACPTWRRLRVACLVIITWPKLAQHETRHRRTRYYSAAVAELSGIYSEFAPVRTNFPPLSASPCVIKAGLSSFRQ